MYSRDGGAWLVPTDEGESDFEELMYLDMLSARLMLDHQQAGMRCSSIVSMGNQTFRSGQECSVCDNHAGNAWAIFRIMTRMSELHNNMSRDYAGRWKQDLSG